MNDRNRRDIRGGAEKYCEISVSVDFRCLHCGEVEP